MKVFSTRLSLFYAAYFIVIGVTLPFFPVWLQSGNLSAGEIAAIIAVPQVIRVIFTPLFALIAGRMGGLKRAILVFSVLGALPFLALPNADGFWPILLIVALSALFWNPVLPLVEALAIAGVKRGSKSYGRMRLWGSWSFIAATVGAGWIVALIMPGDTIWLIVAAYLLSALAAFALVEPQSDEPIDAGRSVTARHAANLFRLTPLMIALTASSLVQASHGVLYVFGTVHWATLGIGYDVAGWLWAIGVIAEIALFAASTLAIQAFGGFGLIALAAFAGIIRWTAYAFDPGLEALFLLQVLHGLTFGASHLGMIQVITKTVPESLTATAQALNFTLAGIAMAASTFIAGALYEDYAGRAYLAMSGVSGLALGLILMGWVLTRRDR